MSGLSNHTLLINELIGFCKETRGWPCPLKDLGYKPELIEPAFKNTKGETVHPDILFSSNRLLHAMLAECKGGACLEGEERAHLELQISRYKGVTNTDLKGIVSVYNPAQMTVDIALASLGEMAPLIEGYQLPLFVFTEKKFERKNKFANQQVDKLFPTELVLESHPPTSYYPFSSDDDDSLIAMKVFQEIVSSTIRAGRNGLDFDAEHILRGIHPHWANIGQGEQERLKKKVDRIIVKYHMAPQLNQKLQRVGGRSWRVVGDLYNFKEGCLTIMRQLDEDPGVGQSSLNVFTNRGLEEDAT